MLGLKEKIKEPMTYAQVAVRCNASERSVARWVAKGLVKTIAHGESGRRITAAEFKRLMKRRVKAVCSTAM